MTVQCGVDNESCAGEHWCEEFDGLPEPGGYRAPCPIDGNGRLLRWEPRGQGIWWDSYCPDHPKEVLRPVLRQRLGECMPGRGPRRVPIDHDDLAALALAGLPPMTLRLRLLVLTGMRTQEALDKLGVRRDNRARVIAGRSGAASKRTKNRRS